MDTKDELSTTKRVLNYIIEFKSQNDGLSPSVREIMNGCGVNSTSVTIYHLRKLREQNIIDYQDRQSRTIKVEGGHWEIPFWFRIHNEPEKEVA